MKELVALLQILGLNTTQAEMLASIFRQQKNLDRGDYFVQRGYTCHNLAFMVDGMCRHYYDTEKGEGTRWVVLPNEFITSLGSFISQRPAEENIQAIKPTALLIASRKDWQEIYDQEEFVRMVWLKSIEENYVGMENRVFNLIAMTAEERYDWMLKHQPRFNQHVPDKYVASMLGILPRHLSRIRASRK
jgi:CRP/FNR family transcriptional regulator, anaerobic regulatory protein